MIDFSKIEAYLFDLGGVIVDISPQAAIDAFKKLGLTDIHENITQSHHGGLFKQYELGMISSDEFVTAVQEQLPRPVEPNQIHDAWNEMLVDLPDARVSLLQRLKATKPVYLLSNTNAIHRQMFIGMARGYDNMEALFTEVFYSYKMHLSKPDIKSFEYVIEKTGVNPCRTLFLDDSEINLETAEQLGFQTALVSAENGVVEVFNEL